MIPPNHLPGFAETFGPNPDQNSRRRENVRYITTPIIFRREPSLPQHRHRPQHHISRRRLPTPHSTSGQRLPTATFIDLTEEPDSPVEAQPSRQSSQSRNQTRTNPRRTNSQRISPPTLSRSDGTISRSNMPDFIDLTGDSPDDDIPQIIESSPRTPNLDHLSHLPRDSLIRADLVRHSRIFGGFRRRLAGLLGSDFLELDLRRPESIPFPFDGFVRRPVPEESRPKPSMEPTPDTREGFTRNTCAEPTEEMVIVCPNCNEELAYDPTGATPAQSSTSGKGTKRKRTVPEHHFWALKKCGHVSSEVIHILEYPLTGSRSTAPTASRTADRPNRTGGALASPCRMERKPLLPPTRCGALSKDAIPRWHPRASGLDCTLSTQVQPFRAGVYYLPTLSRWVL